MNSVLLEHNSLRVDDFLAPARCAELSRELVDYVARTETRGDGQCPRSPSVYNFLPFVELLLEKLPLMQAKVGESLFPTFCYARSYVHGEELAAHTDRPSSEVSATLNLDGDADWPIYFTRPDHETVEVLLRPGQAAIYLGCAARHWRRPFTGTYCRQVFLHYVRSRGRYALACFDNRTPEINGIRY